MPTGKIPPRLLIGLGALAAAASALAGCGSSSDVRPTQWSYIAPAIIEPTCATANCHSAFAARAGLDLSTRDTGYNMLLNRHFVIPGHSDTSEIIFLMTAIGAPRMPPDFPLPAADIELIARWIDEDNAMNN